MMAKNFLNFLVFQAAWFITVLSAAAGKPYAGVVFTFAWMIIHLQLFTTKKVQELGLIMFAAVLGFIVDSTQVLLGVFSFPPAAAWGWPTTLWMMALWINLAATLNYSLSWLKNSYILAAVLGAVSGPLAYYAGSRLGAMIFEMPWSLAAVSLQWFVCMPLLLYFARSGFLVRRKSICVNSAVVGE